MKTAIYGRVSTQKQEEEETIVSQIKQLKEYAEKNNIIIMNEDKYIDDGYSGELLNRPGLDKLRDDASRKIFDAVLITCPDRLARKYVHQAIVLEELEQQSIKVVFLNRPIANTMEDKLLLGMQGLFAEYEKEKIKERTRRGKQHKAKEGIVVGGIAPYGYEYIKKTDKRNGYYIIKEKEAEVVKLIFNLFVGEKLSIRELVRRLAKMNITPPNGQKVWAKSTVSRILRNETYIGITYYNKHYRISCPEEEKEKYRRTPKKEVKLRDKEEWIPIKVLAMIEKEIFEKAEKQLDENSRFSSRNTKNKYLLRGLVRCGECGSLFFGTPCHDKTYYRCSNRYKTFPFPRTCNASMIKASKLDSLVWQTVSETLRNPDLILEEIRKSQEEAKNRNSAVEMLSRLNADAERLENRKQKVIRAYSEDLLNMEELKTAMKEIRNEEAKLAREKERLKSQIASAKDKTLKAENLKKICSMVSENMQNISFEKRQKVLRLLIEEIVLKNGNLSIKCALPLEPQANQSLLEESCHIASQPC